MKNLARASVVLSLAAILFTSRVAQASCSDQRAAGLAFIAIGAAGVAATGAYAAYFGAASSSTDDDSSDSTSTTLTTSPPPVAPLYIMGPTSVALLTLGIILHEVPCSDRSASRSGPRGVGPALAGASWSTVGARAIPRVELGGQHAQVVWAF